MRPQHLKVLSDSEIENIHNATIEILGQTGVLVQHKKLLLKLKKAGAIIDETKGIAKFPEKTVNRFVNKAPSCFKLFGRNGREPLEIGKGITHSVSGFDSTFFLNPEKGTRKPIKLEEVGNFAWIADCLESIDIAGIQGIPQDVPQEFAEAYSVLSLLENTSKHIVIAPDTGDVARIVYKILDAVSVTKNIGDEPFVSCHISPSAPLRWTPHACEIIIETVSHGVPFLILPAPMAGATSPVTLAGHLTVHNTEIVSGILISQILKENSPVVYCNAHTIFNMREGNPIIATPETLLLRTAGAQMARFYNIPSHSIGFDTDSHITDQQGTWEKAMSAMVCVQSGIDLMVNLGMFSTGLTVSYASLVLDAEVFDLLKRYREGIEVSRESIASDLIKQVGPWGEYLTGEHTLKNYKKENWYPSISCRKLIEPWENEGSKTTETIAQEKAMELINRERKTYIDKNKVAEIKKIISNF